MHLEMTPHVSIVRVYDRPDGYALRLPYLGALVVTHLTDTTVWVHTALGTVTRQTYDQALATLRAQGVTTLMYERRGNMQTKTLPAIAAEPATSNTNTGAPHVRNDRHL